MNINDWTNALNHWLTCLSAAPGELERRQAKLMIGSCLVVMERDMSRSIAGSACHLNGMSLDEAEEYKALYEASTRAREVFV